VANERPSSAVSNIANLSEYRELKQYSAAGPILETSSEGQLSTEIEGTAKKTGLAPMATESELRAAEIAAAEARTDTKIARLEGKMDLVLESIRSSRDEARDNRRSVIANAWVIFGALIVVIGIIVTVAPAILEFGFKWRDTITNEVHEQVSRVPPAKPQQ
jgi:hypothetical protein